MFELINVVRILLFINLIILHQHGSNCQIKDEKCANPNTRYEEKVHESWRVKLLVHVHDFGPPIHCRHDENGHEGAPDVIKVCDAVVEILNVCVDPKVVISEIVLCSVWIKLFKS